MHNLNNTIKQWNDCFIRDMNFKHLQMWNKEFVTIDQKIIYDYQNIKYHMTKTWK
jgi:hypothetical protein